MSTESFDLTRRLEELELLSGALVAPRRPGQHESVTNPPPVALVPVPRRSRVFLRHGEGHGTFADVTLTAPIVRSYLT